MRAVFCPAILALTLCVLVNAAAAETRKVRPVMPGKKPATSAAIVAEPLKITPPSRTAQPRAHPVQPKAATTARAKPKTPATSRVSHRPLVAKRALKAQRPRAVIPSQSLVDLSREANAPATADAPIALTRPQEHTIYRIIAEIPLQPRSVPIERVLPTVKSLPSSEKPTFNAIPRTAIVESEPVVGAQLPLTIPLHQMPPDAVTAVPEIGHYGYAFVGDRVLLVDPATGIVVAAIRRD
jgi:hypothetical protein